MGRTTSHFELITKAIAYINSSFREQPSLEEIAREVNLSPFHFQRIFTEWAGVSPKQFLQFLSLNHAKAMLKEKQLSLFDTAIETGLSGTGRLHDLFIKMEGMTPAEFKNGAENLSINYSFGETRFGPVIIASTAKGICYMAFFEDGPSAFEQLKQPFPKAKFFQQTDSLQQDALQSINYPLEKRLVRLHVKGSAFQLKVWEALLKIPCGGLSTYSSIAAQVDNGKAFRAVGTAVGDNPVAYLIPCHRIIRSTGVFGQYHWGPERKAAMIAWEAAQSSARASILFQDPSESLQENAPLFPASPSR